MQTTARGVTRAALLASWLVAVALPLVAGLLLALAQSFDARAWRELWAEPQWRAALAASVRIGVVATLISLGLALSITTALHGGAAWLRFTRWLAPMLALPHAAFAIGFALLVMPSGLLARLLAPLLGWAQPPAASLVQDPLGLSMIVVLVAKELPFLLWNIAALLARPEVASTTARQLAVGRSLGYSSGDIWWRVLWPLWLPRLAAPLLAVAAYSLSVVDVALLIGPLAPPTLAVLAWGWLTRADPLHNTMGAAAAVMLALVLAVLVALAAASTWLWRDAMRKRATRGVRPAGRARAMSPWRRSAVAMLTRGVIVLYVSVALMLLWMSIAGVWTFPSLVPALWSLDAWTQVALSSRTLLFTAGVAAAAALLAVALALAWFEAVPAAWDRRAAAVLMLPVVLPQVLLLAGLTQAALWLRLDGSVGGLLWVHALVALPYVSVVLAPAWRSFDPRYQWTALALQRSRLAFWWRVKLTMLRAPLAAALAVGFAVSVATYLPTQFIGAGRFATVTTEAVTLASGGQRTLAAAYAVLQAALPLFGFALAHAVASRGFQSRERPDHDGA